MLTRKPAVALGSRSPRLLPKAHAIVGRSSNRSIRRAAGADDVEASHMTPPPGMEYGEVDNKIFPEHLSKSGIQGVLSSLPLPMFYAAMAGFVAAAGFGGAIVGRGAVPEDSENRDAATYAAAGLSAAVTAVAAMQAKKVRASGAVVDLYNEIVDLPDPSLLTADIVSNVEKNYGISMQVEELDGLQRIYSQYLEALIPKEDDQLRGDEADKLISFMAALGLSDESAAPAHIDLGRRLFRQSDETKDRFQKFEQRKAFQRLVYVSHLVFGDQKSSFLLPWRRIFNLTDAQMHVARRDNAKIVFKAHLDQHGGYIPADRNFLRELRDYQMSIKVMDSSVKELMKDYTRNNVERRLEKCLEIVKLAAGDVAGLCEEVRHIIDYSRKMCQYADEEDLIPGLGRPTIEGSPLANPVTGKTKELREVFKAFLGEELEKHGEFTKELDDECKELQAILCIPSQEASELRVEMTSKLYRRLLKEVVVSRRIDSASSPADVLQELRNKVCFPAEAASKVHLQLYKQKLSTLLAIKKHFNDADKADLARMRRVLCMDADVIRAAQRDTVVKELQDVVADLFTLPADPVPKSEVARLDTVVKELEIDPVIVQETLQQATVDKFRSYVEAAMKGGQDRKVAPNVMKKMLQFNALVVTPLLERAKSYCGSDPLPEPFTPGKAGAEEEEEQPKGQLAVTLGKEVEPAVRMTLYKKYVVFSLSGRDGGRPKRGQKEPQMKGAERKAELERLSDVGVLLGMSKAEIDRVHEEVAHESYKDEVKDIMRAGQLTERADYLEDLRIQLDIMDDQVINKLQKEVRDEMSTSGAMSEEGSKWTLDRAIKLAESGGNVENVMEEVSRRNLYRKELEARISDGTGDLQSDYILETLPRVLMLEKRKVDLVLKELVGSRRRVLLVQAISNLRQKQRASAIVALNNLISCNRALPEKGAMPWTEQRELRDLFGAYCEKVDDASKRSVLQSLFGISDEEAAALTQTVAMSGQKVPEEEEESFF